MPRLILATLLATLLFGLSAAAERPNPDPLAGTQCTSGATAAEGAAPTLELGVPEPQALTCQSGISCPFGFCKFIQNTPPGQCINGCCYYEAPCEMQCELTTDCAAPFEYSCVEGCCTRI